MRRPSRLLIVAAAAATSVAPAAPPNLRAEPAPWTATWIDASVHLDGAGRRLVVDGTLRVRAGDPPDTFTLVLGPGGLRFDSVEVVGATVSFSRQRDSCRIAFRTSLPPGREVTVRFRTAGQGEISRSVIIRPEGALVSPGGGWHPLVAAASGPPDPRVPGTLRFDVPAEWRTISNGVLIDSSVSGGRRRESWLARRPVYRSVVAAPFSTRLSHWIATPVTVGLLPRHVDRADVYAEAIPRMVEVLETLFGPYPFESFGVAEVPHAVAPPGFAGRAEAGYFVAHTDALAVPGVNVQVFAHELVHMWFPLTVDSRPPGDDMMDEAIANYGVVAYLAAMEGPTRARRELVEGHPDFSMRGYFHYLRLGVDEPLMAEYSPLIARSKGPLVYDMLRKLVGDSVFFGTWQSLRAKYEAQGISLTEFRSEIQQRAQGVSGLQTFFAQWLDRAGAPELHAEWTQTAGQLRLRVTQRGDAYELQVPVRIQSTVGTVDTLLRVRRASEDFAMPVNGRVTGIELDPEHSLLLWHPRFGPPPSAPRSWAAARWEPWFAAELQWLMRHYEGDRVHVLLRDGDRLEPMRNYRRDGDGAVDREAEAALRDAIGRAAPVSETDSGARSRWVESPFGALLVVDHPSTGGRIAVLAREGWGRYQLAIHTAQRLAIQRGWRRPEGIGR
jgi:hypothetical protein